MATILEEASAAIYGARESDYGHPRKNFERIAAMWSVILGHEVTAPQAVLMMMAVKISRLSNSIDHRDSWVDIAGYAETGARVLGLDP